VRQQGARLRELLVERLGGHPDVGDIRGRGLLQGLELVADRASKRPFAPERRLHARIKSEAMLRGLMCYPNGGTIDGSRGDHVLLAPPYIVTNSELELIVERLAAALDAALAAVDQAAA
jgi:adenosylmethionine-8-amino-7-oxononanoate aminotransferase